MVRKTQTKAKTSTTSTHSTDKPQADAAPKQETVSDSKKQPAGKDAEQKQEGKTTSAADKSKADTAKTSDKKKDEEQDTFTVLIKAQASKISPKSEGTIGYELVKDEEGVLFLRLTSNTSSGNFCKTPVALQSVIDILNKQVADKAFNSKIMSSVFQGKGSKNSNNTSFLMAALRSKDMGLTVADSKSPLSSNLSAAFKVQTKKLLGMS